MPADTARDKKTLEEVDALELLRRVLDEEDPLDVNAVYARQFICLACNATKTPVAIKPKMKLSPHFRLQGEHEPGCDIDGYEKLLSEGRKSQISNSLGFPVPYPSKLRLPTFREVIDNSVTQESKKPRVEVLLQAQVVKREQTKSIISQSRLSNA